MGLYLYLELHFKPRSPTKCLWEIPTIQKLLLDQISQYDLRVDRKSHRQVVFCLKADRDDPGMTLSAEPTHEARIEALHVLMQTEYRVFRQRSNPSPLSIRDNVLIARKGSSR